MDDKQPLWTLANGLELFLEESSNRYFGDYHRVRLILTCDLPVSAVWLGDADDPAAEAIRLRGLLGDSVRYEKVLERMGVPGADVARVRRQLLDDFSATARLYLESPEFPSRLLRQRARQLRQRNPGLRVR